jgi:hypothetical protein
MGAKSSASYSGLFRICFIPFGFRRENLKRMNSIGNIGQYNKEFIMPNWQRLLSIWHH